MRFRISNRVFGLAVAAGLLLQIAALPLRGTRDVDTFKRWAANALWVGVPNAYSARPVDPGGAYLQPPDYPPLAVYLLATVTSVARGVMGRPLDPSHFAAFVKLPILLLHAAVLVAVVASVKRLSGSDDTAKLAGLAFWLNPALMLNGPTLGYLDTLCWLPGLAAVVAASRGWAGSAGTLTALAALTKPQGLMFFVPVVTALWRTPGAGLARGLGNAGVVMSLAVVPFYLAAPRGFLEGLQANFREDFLSGNAMNLWWLVTGAMGFARAGLAILNERMAPASIEDFSRWLGVAPRIPAALAVIAFAAWAAWRVRGTRSLPVIAGLTAVMFHFYFVFSVSVHENHLVYAVPFAGVVALFHQRYGRLYIGISACVAANLFLFYGFGQDFRGLPRDSLFWPVTMAGSCAAIALLAYHVREFLRLADVHGAAPDT